MKGVKIEKKKIIDTDRKDADYSKNKSVLDGLNKAVEKMKSKK